MPGSMAWPSPSTSRGSNAASGAYKATNLSLSKKHEDFDEFTEVEIFTLEEVKNMIKSGEIIDAKTITALAYTMIMDNY